MGRSAARCPAWRRGPHSRPWPPPLQLTPARVTPPANSGRPAAGPSMIPPANSTAPRGPLSSSPLRPPARALRPWVRITADPTSASAQAGGDRRARGARRCLLLAAHNARAPRPPACAQQQREPGGGSCVRPAPALRVAPRARGSCGLRAPLSETLTSFRRWAEGWGSGRSGRTPAFLRSLDFGRKQEPWP